MSGFIVRLVTRNVTRYIAQARNGCMTITESPSEAYVFTSHETAMIAAEVSNVRWKVDSREIIPAES